MANSGIPWIDTVFDWCVQALFDMAAVIGITYEEINVWLFVIVGPTVLAASLAVNAFLTYRLARLEREA